MTMRFYGLKTCDTCKKAQKALADAGAAFEAVDVRADGVPDATLAHWIDALGADALVNRRSTTWRGLSEAEKAAADRPQETRALLAAHPTLIKRPVIDADGALHVGWSKATQAAMIG